MKFGFHRLNVIPRSTVTLKILYGFVYCVHSVYSCVLKKYFINACNSTVKRSS